MNESKAGQPRRPWRILLIVAAIVIGLSIYGQLGKEKYAAPRDGLGTGEESFTGLSSPAAPPVRAPEDADALTERLEQPDPSLTVKVVTEEGAPIADAAITAEGPNERKFEALGSARWEQMASGPWTVTASAPGYFEESEGVNLRKGKDGDLTIELREAALIRGTVRTTFGYPARAVEILFLQEGEAHPLLPDERARFPRCNPDAGGSFVSPSLAAGRYRISIRTGGNSFLESEYATLAEGQRKEAEIVLDRFGLLRIEFDGSLALPAKGITIRLERLEEPLLQRFSETQPTPEQQAAAKRRERWRPEQMERIHSLEPFFVQRVRAGKYRITMVVQDLGRIQSQPFETDGVQPLNVQLLLPKDPAPATGQDGPPLAEVRIDAESREFPARREPQINWLD